MISKDNLEERFDKTINDMNFNIIEMEGFKQRPFLAIKVGLAKGYQLGLDDGLQEVYKIYKKKEELK